MDIFSTNVLAKVVERLHTPSSFLLDTFFPNVQTSDKEEIFFDVTDSKPHISPFVSPLLPGKVVDSGGYQTKSFKPAYVKDKRRFDANIPYMAKRIKDVRENGAKDENLPDLEDITKREAFADQQLILGLALAGIIEWDGILEADTDEKAALTPVKIEELFTNFWSIAETFRQQYCGIQEILEAEKNAYTPEQDGTSAPGETTAKDAASKKSTASSTDADTSKQP